MRTAKEVEGRACPRCASAQGQSSYGFNRSGTKRSKCNCCGHVYTMRPKNRAYPEEVRERAIAAFNSGASGRAVGKMLGMSKANVYNWLNKRGERRG